MMSSRELAAGLLSLVALGASMAHAGALQNFEAVEAHMGTLFRIKLYAADSGVAQKAFRAAFDRVAQLDEILSDYKSESELNRVSRTAVGNWVRVSDDLFTVASAAQQLSEESEGAFDLTIGPLTHLWRVARKQGKLPDADAVGEKLLRCSYRKLHLDRATQSIKLDTPGMQLDAGGIAKGYAADQALAVLGKIGIPSALVAASGDLAFSDAPPGKRGWSIGVDSLDTAGQPFTRALTLANRAVSTSGDTEQHVDVSGKRYSHILDPMTGLGLTSNLTVTVIAKSGMAADATATALSVLGVEKGSAFVLERPDLTALMVDRSMEPARSIELRALVQERSFE